MKLPLFKKMNEAAWLLGIIFCALGVCLLTKAGFGLSMVSAAAYILHLKVVQFLPFFRKECRNMYFRRCCCWFCVWLFNGLTGAICSRLLRPLFLALCWMAGT